MVTVELRNNASHVKRCHFPGPLKWRYVHINNDNQGVFWASHPNESTWHIKARLKVAGGGPANLKWMLKLPPSQVPSPNYENVKRIPFELLLQNGLVRKQKIPTNIFINLHIYYSSSLSFL
ncbi:hypothetical protein ACOSQ3_001672 [Xanthoceras sorbifolium]